MTSGLKWFSASKLSLLIVALAVLPGIIAYNASAQVAPPDKCQFQVTDLAGGPNCADWLNRCFCGSQNCADCMSGSSRFTDPNCGEIEITELDVCCWGEYINYCTCAPEP